jgi:hypothetical protein
MTTVVVLFVRSRSEILDDEDVNMDAGYNRFESLLLRFVLLLLLLVFQPPRHLGLVLVLLLLIVIVS